MIYHGHPWPSYDWWETANHVIWSRCAADHCNRLAQALGVHCPPSCLHSCSAEQRLLSTTQMLRAMNLHEEVVELISAWQQGQLLQVCSPEMRGYQNYSIHFCSLLPCHAGWQGKVRWSFHRIRPRHYTRIVYLYIYIYILRIQYNMYGHWW